MGYARERNFLFIDASYIEPTPKSKAYVIPQRRSSVEEEEAEEMERLFREVFNCRDGGSGDGDDDDDDLKVRVPRLMYGDIFQSKYNFAHFWLSFVQCKPCGFARITQASLSAYARPHKCRGLVSVVFNTESALWEDENVVEATTGVTKHHQSHRFECKDAFDTTKVSTEAGTAFSVRACKSVFHPLLVVDFTRHLRKRLEVRHFKERNDAHRLYYNNSGGGGGTGTTAIHEALNELDNLELLSIQCWKTAVVNFRLPQMRCLKGKECTDKEMPHLLDFYH